MSELSHIFRVVQFEAEESVKFDHSEMAFKQSKQLFRLPRTDFFNKAGFRRVRCIQRFVGSMTLAVAFLKESHCRSKYAVLVFSIPLAVDFMKIRTGELFSGSEVLQEI